MLKAKQIAKLFLFGCWLWATLASAQPSSNGASPPDEAVAYATRTESAPVLDGDILSDPVWQQARATSGFWQTTPDEGSSASQKTEIRIMYTADTLYIGAVCYDREPDKIIVSDSRRDASLEETDAISFILDTYHDKQNGFVFGTNPAGIEYDGQVSNEGEGGGGTARQLGGSGGGFNINWDGAWLVRTQVSEIGWSAEFAIPFRTLRFSQKDRQTWGVNFQRNVRRRNETAYWAKLPRQYSLYRLSQAGELRGLHLRTPKNLKVMPYLLGEGDKNFAAGTAADWDNEVGVDAKYSITPSLTLDATYNTDFAQVEVDEQQINFDRFNLFFPEKRPFFLENSGVFSVGSPGEVEMFFSRRIGIDEEGRRIPIVGGARVSGKVSGVSVGLLNMQTESRTFTTDEGIDTVQSNNFTVVRLNQELRNRSAIGVMVVNRQGTGGFAPSEDYNRTFALDGKLGIGQNTQFSGFAAKTSTSGTSGDDYAFKGGVAYNSQAWQLSADYTEVAKNFNPQAGFLQRNEFRKVSFLIYNRSRPKNNIGFHEMRPHISYRGFWDFAGFQETGFLHIDSHWEWKNGYEFHTGINFTKEGVKEVFELGEVMVPAATYNHQEIQFVGYTNRGKPVSLSTTVTIGGFFGGDRFAASNTLDVRFGETFTTQLIYNYNNINLPNGEFNTNLLRVRASYSFTPRIYLQGLVQYNDSADIWSTNVRFGWLQSANSGLFLVYNEVQDVLNDTFTINNRSFIVKYTYLLDVFN